MLKSLIIVGLAASIGLCDTEGPLVQITEGQVRGTFKLSRNGRIFGAFEGIPYAQPPTGQLRFRPPVPKAPWTGTLNATSNNINCLQVRHEPWNPSTTNGTEDCLYLNVYTPHLNPEQKLDVIVFFHGGAFMFGSADTHSEYNLMDRDVVFVMANYRLGPLGFLSTEDSVVPGNNGLRDQVLVLQWVQSNIRQFGGNPDSVTIAGNSAGSASVHYHLLSPLSQGLFHRGISSSGVALNCWALAEKPLQKTRKIGELVGCTHNNTEDLVNCLRQKSGVQITETIKHFQPWLYNPFTPFGPVVERAGEGKFLPDLPYNLLRQGQVADVPWLTSVTSEEGLYPAADFVATDDRLPYLEQHWLELAPYILHYDNTVPKAEHADVAQKIKEYYLKGKPISRETFPELVQAIGDRLFVVDAEKAARLQAQVNESPVYFYRFSYRGAFSLAEYYRVTDKTLGVSHMDDLFYILPPDVEKYPDYLELDADKDMVEVLLDIWTTFAQTGKPTVANVDWYPVARNQYDKLRYLQISSPSNVTSAEIDYLGHRPFWDSLPFRENEKISFITTLQ